MAEEDFQDLIQVSMEAPEPVQADGQENDLEVSCGGKTKLYLMGLPNSGNRVASILINPTGGVARVKFLTESLEDVQISGVSPQHAERWLRNSSRLLSAVKHSLRTVPSTSNVCQMRVTLGSFVFDQYRVPMDLRAGYSVDDFDGMLRHEMSSGHLVSGLNLSQQLLLDRISQASRLFALERGHSPASNIQHAVKVEFASKEKKSLHLEVDFKLSGRHYEQVKSRWVESPIVRPSAQNRPLLQAVMINPERADWELKIREKLILDADQISVSMREFQHQIRLRDSVVEESLSTNPKRRTIIPSGFAVRRLMEKAAMRFPIQGTDYILEVARYDVYDPKPKQARDALSAAQMDFKPPFSTWEAVILGESWDREMVNVGKWTYGRNVNIDAGLKKFFKQKQGETQRAAFERFIKIVTDVAGLWDQNGSHLPELMSAIEGTLIELD
ncbi:hypothetical protein UA08_04510 [Talaromyces atroroseus]|uniref:DUF7905 domain-containing protein n=1 Tax=Talaromyces atroroseus TaxID=1441469 RepID=A0A225AHP5_TALAT|nr:hypothetical protein UA08_04510 [Talaromyces atroroseus]OKL60270.1 hypothetical protein UA08_04510 [Talaromyces atroroseus]